MSVRRNTGYNIAGALIPLLAILVTLPLYLAAIGEPRYGVLAIVWTLLGYFGLFDLGLGRAITNRIAALRDAPVSVRSQVFWTAIAINVLLGLLAALIVWMVGALVVREFLEVTDQLVGEVDAALPWIALCVPALLASSVMSGALMGREDFLAQNAVRAVEGVFIQVAPLLVAIYVQPHIEPIVIAVLLVRLASTVALFLLCITRLPLVRPRAFEWAEARTLTVFGGWVTVTSIIGPILSTLDRVILGAIAGMRAVTHYTVPFGLVSRISILPGSLSSALFPRFSAQTDDLEHSALQDRAVLALSVVLIPLIVPAILFMAPFLVWWIDAEFSQNAARAGEILLIGIWANCLAYVPFARIQGSGRPDIVAKIHLAEVIPYLALLWFALHTWGVEGAAAAWALRSSADASFMFLASRSHATSLQQLVTPTLLVITAFFVVVVLDWTSLLRWILTGVFLLGAALWTWNTAPPELRRIIERDAEPPVSNPQQ